MAETSAPRAEGDPAADETAVAPDATAAGADEGTTGHRRAWVNAARLALAMLGIAAVVLLALGGAFLVLGDPPEVSGWLRAIFGRVFGVVAVGLAATLGIPSGIGLWAMAGANSPGAVPALGRTARLAAVGVGAAVTALTALVLLVSGAAIAILNVALLALVGMATLGLAGAVASSRHRWRAVASLVALVAVALGAVWILNAAFIGRPA